MTEWQPSRPQPYPPRSYPQQPPPPTRPQPAYQPQSLTPVPPPPTQRQPYPQQPPPPYRQPAPAITPYQPQPNGMPQTWPTQTPPQRGKHTGLKIFGALFAVAVVTAVIATAFGKSPQSSDSGTSANTSGSPATLGQSDGYSLINSGSGTVLSNGITVNWAEGSNASNVGILVVQTDNATDAGIEAAELQSESTAVTVTQNGDIVTLLDPNGAGDISSWLRANGWTN